MGDTIQLTPERPLALLGLYTIVVNGVTNKQGHGIESHTSPASRCVTLVWLEENDIYVARRPRAAFDWTLLGQISSGLYANTSESHLAGRGNSFIAIWFDRTAESDRSSVIASFWKPDTGWSKSEVIYTSSMTLTYAALAIDPLGNAFVAWSEGGTTKSMRFAAGAWRDVTTMSEPGVYVPEASLAVDDQGRGFIAWAQGDDGAVVRRFE